MRVILLLLLSSCGGNGEDFIRDNINPIRFKGINKDILPYYESFRAYFNTPVNRIAGYFGLLEAPLAGRCVIYKGGTREIIIDTTYWAEASPVEKEILIYHELGHCAMGRDHNSARDLEKNSRKLSIMHPVLLRESVYLKYKEEYIKELSGLTE